MHVCFSEFASQGKYRGSEAAQHLFCVFLFFFHRTCRRISFFDEAGQATIPESLIPICLTQDDTSIILAGNPQQLGPHVHSQIAQQEGLEESLLEDCITRLEDKKKQTPDSSYDCSVTLKKNYRSHSNIFGIPSSFFYNNTLQSAAETSATKLPKGLYKLFFGRDGNDFYRNLFIGVHGAERFENSKSQSQSEKWSFSNSLECECVCEIISGLIDVGIESADIEVIAVYRRQVLLLRRVLRKFGLHTICASTIDDYQGQEAKIIISTVASRGPKNDNDSRQ